MVQKFLIKFLIFFFQKGEFFSFLRFKKNYFLILKGKELNISKL